jgi:hypothetical protein
MTRLLKIIALSVALVLGATATMAGTELVMVEERGCIWCARWNAEVGPIYPASTEGVYAPLRRIDLRGERPEDLTFKAPLRITPTFVLIDEGAEVARLEGYPGEDFFWGLLNKMLSDHTDFEGGTP